MKTNIIANNSIINTIMKNVVKYLCAVVLLIGTSARAWATDCTYKVYDSSTSSWATYTVQDQDLDVIPGPDRTAAGYTFIGWHTNDPDVYPGWPTSSTGYLKTTDAGAPGGEYVRYIPNTAGSGKVKNTGKNVTSLYAIYKPTNASAPDWGWTGNSGWSAGTTQQVTITFNANGGTGTMPTQTILKNTPTALRICDFDAPAGKTFAGWSTNSGASSPTYGDNGVVSLSSNTILYAIWQNSGTYSVTYNLTGVTVTSGPTTVSNTDDDLEIYFTVNSGYTSVGIYGQVCVQPDGYLWCYNTDDDYNIEFGLTTRLDFVYDGTFDGNVVVTITAQEVSCTMPTVAFGTGTNRTVTVGASGWTDAATATYSASSTDQTITYSSSNTGAATVNSTTGEVTIGSTAGTTTITATAAEKGIYCEALATYTITVNPNIPTVSATETGKELTATPTSPTGVTFHGGVIKSYGGGTVSAHGYVYGTTSMPTLSNSHIEWNQSRAIDKVWGNQYPSGLTPGATYYVRAYATNEAGTGYSPTQVTFTMPMAYTITLNNQSATTAGTESIEVWADDDHNLTGTPAITLPTKTGYTFGGYYTATGGSGVQIIDDAGTVNASAGGGSTYTDASKNWKYGNNIELYAKWTAKTYTLSLDNQSPTTASTPTSVTVTYNASTNLTGTVVTTLPTKTGYTFGGYYTGTSGSGVQLITDAGVVNASVTGYTDASKNWIKDGDATVTVYAKWTADEIELVLSANGGEDDGSATVVYDATGLKGGTLVHATYAGHTLEGYYDDADHTTKVLNSDGSFAATNVTGYITAGKWTRTTDPTELYAFWAANPQTVTFDLHGKGDNFTRVVDNGTPVARPADPTHIDYNFDDWYTDDGAGNPTNTKYNFSTNVTEDITIHAKWTAKEYENLIFACVDLTLVTEDGDPVLVTSRNGINIMATKKLKLSVSGALAGHRVSITGTDLKFYKNDGTRFVELTGSNSLVAPLDEQVVYVSYNPSAATLGAIATPSITVACDGFEETFAGKVKARQIGDAVAIVAKVGNTWQALSADIASASYPAPVMVSTATVDGVLKAYGPSTLSYKLWPTATVNSANSRWGDATAAAPSALYGDRLRFSAPNNTTTANGGLWANNSSTSNKISNGTGVIDEVGDYFANDAGYEWIVTTTEVDGQFVYTLQTDQASNTNNLRLWGKKWGTYGSSYGTADLYILPLVETATADMTIMEWGTNMVAVKYENASTVASGTFKASINGADKTDVTCTSLGGDIYKLTGIGTVQDYPGKQLVLTMTETSTAKQAVFAIPLIVTASKTEAEISSYAAGGNGSTLITEGRAIAKNLDVIVRQGGTLTTGTAQGKFANLYIYPGGKVELSNNISFGNIYLRGGFSWLEASKDYKLPQMKVDDDITIDGIQHEGNGVYYDLYLDKRRYYMMAVPKDVALNDITNEEGGDEFTAWLKQYSGKGRTQTPKTSGWVNMNTPKLLRGVGYEMSIKPRVTGRTIGILRMPLLQSTAWTNEGECMPAVKAWGYNDDNVTANNKGWN